MERIVFLDRKTYRIEFPVPRFAHQWKDYDLTRPAEIAERIHDATIVITNKVQLREVALKSAPALRLIAVAATGVDCVDLNYCRQNNIAVCNVPHYTRNSVPEHVFMGLLALRRNLFNIRSAMCAGAWPKSDMFTVLDYPLHGIAGTTLGLIGYGTLGKEVEKRALAFGMKILIAERKHADTIRAGRTSFETVLKESDVISLHCPLSAETRHLIGSTELTKMKPHTILINLARGGIVDEDALAQALRTKLLGGAFLDVLRDEPPPANHPLLNLDLPNLLITPHLAWASGEALRTMADTVVNNLEAFVAGIPKNLVP